MDCNTGDIVYLGEEDFKDLEKLKNRMDYDGRKRLEDALKEQTEKQMLALTESEAKELTPLSKKARKNNMRNKPCVCGSDIKFKKCCWGKYV